MQPGSNGQSSWGLTLFGALPPAFGGALVPAYFALNAGAPGPLTALAVAAGSAIGAGISVALNRPAQGLAPLLGDAVLVDLGRLIRMQKDELRRLQGSLRGLEAQHHRPWTEELAVVEDIVNSGRRTFGSADERRRAIDRLREDVEASKRYIANYKVQGYHRVAKVITDQVEAHATLLEEGVRLRRADRKGLTAPEEAQHGAVQLLERIERYRQVVPRYQRFLTRLTASARANPESEAALALGPKLEAALLYVNEAGPALDRQASAARELIADCTSDVLSHYRSQLEDLLSAKPTRRGDRKLAATTLAAVARLREADALRDDLSALLSEQNPPPGLRRAVERLESERALLSAQCLRVASDLDPEQADWLLGHALET